MNKGDKHKSNIPEIETQGKWRYTPRFDFGTDCKNDHSETATLADLLDEIQFENTHDKWGNLIDKTGKKIDISYLKTVLRFFRSITGKELKKTTELHSVADIKTIKYLYRQNENISTQLISFIEPSSKKNLLLLDTITSEKSEESSAVLYLIEEVIKTVSNQIAKDELERIKEVRDCLDAHYDYTNTLIDDIIYTRIHRDEKLSLDALLFICEETENYHNSIKPLIKENRIIISTYTYLMVMIILFRHRISIENQKRISGDKISSCSEVKFEEICRKVSLDYNRTIMKYTNFISEDNFLEFSKVYASYIVKLVKAATNNKYSKKDLMNDSERAKTVLEMHLSAHGYPNEENPNPIGIVHIVSSYCAILHQRLTKDRLRKKSRRYDSKFFYEPQKQLDRYASKSLSHIPFSAGYLYREILERYLCMMSGTLVQHDYNKAIFVAQSRLYIDIYMSLDHKQIMSKLDEYRKHMADASQRFVEMHNRQEPIYKMIPLV